MRSSFASKSRFSRTSAWFCRCAIQRSRPRSLARHSHSLDPRICLPASDFDKRARECRRRAETDRCWFFSICRRQTTICIRSLTLACNVQCHGFVPVERFVLDLAEFRATLVERTLVGVDDDNFNKHATHCSEISARQHCLFVCFFFR